MRTKEKEQELLRVLDANMILIKSAAMNMDFDDLWECASLFHVYKRLHWYLTNLHEFTEYQLDALLPFAYPLFVLVDFYDDIEDEDSSFEMLMDYAADEIKSGAAIPRPDWQTLAAALRK